MSARSAGKRRRLEFLCRSLAKGARSSEVLVLCGAVWDRNRSPVFWPRAGAGLGSRNDARREAPGQRVDRLRTTLRIASQLGSTHETKPLLEMIAAEAARLLEADRSSIFTWDREHHEVVACPALGFEGNLLRLPDNMGIVGECLHTGKPIVVDDAYGDPRFNRQVDANRVIRRTISCACRLSMHGEHRIGAFEAINKRQGSFTAEDEESLAELGCKPRSRWRIHARTRASRPPA